MGRGGFLVIRYILAFLWALVPWLVCCLHLAALLGTLMYTHTHLWVFMSVSECNEVQAGGVLVSPGNFYGPYTLVYFSILGIVI